jgi:hypothetical protein
MHWWQESYVYAKKWPKSEQIRRLGVNNIGLNTARPSRLRPNSLPPSFGAPSPFYSAGVDERFMFEKAGMPTEARADTLSEKDAPRTKAMFFRSPLEKLGPDRPFAGAGSRCRTGTA